MSSFLFILFLSAEPIFPGEGFAGLLSNDIILPAMRKKIGDAV